MQIPLPLRQRYQQFRQDHVFRWWDTLSEAQQQFLAAQLEAIDLDTVQQFFLKRDETILLANPKRCKPIPTVELQETDAATRVMGEAALRKGEVAVVVVAGGQGTRLGFLQPKGLFSIGPVSEKPLFQIHAEKVLALCRRYRTNIPLLVMTGPATDAPTRSFFAANRNFGLPADQVYFFCQGSMPALDAANGKLLMEDRGRLCLSPNGHGGMLTALPESGLLDFLEHRGVRDLFYFQVDNPLVQIADPLFLGHHRRQNAEVSSKAVEKTAAGEMMGLFLLFMDRCSMVEYSDLPDSMAEARDAAGQFQFRWCNPAIHIFQLAFLRRVYESAGRIPYHIARKKVAAVDDRGTPVEPRDKNALKFEMFIFDLLPLTDRWTVVETRREDEFAPIKNEGGVDSPETAQKAMTHLAAVWLENAGVAVPRSAAGEPLYPLEISPLLALDAQELAKKIQPGVTIQGPTYFSERGIEKG